MTTLNFDFNGYSSSDSFGTALADACRSKRVSVEESAVDYTPMCSDSSENLWYYDMYSEQEKAQCRFTWNWEVNEPSVVYSPDGPFPNVNTVHCPGATTQSPTTQTPTTIVPTTETPTTIVPTTETPTIVPTTCPPVEIAFVPSELAPNPETIEEIIITSELCSSYQGTKFILSGLPALKSIVIGDNCFGNMRVFALDGLCELESVVIGQKSFRIGSSEQGDGSYRIENSPKLKSIQIGYRSFEDYHSFELNNLPSLQSIDIGDYCFDWVPSLSLTSLIDGLV